MMMEVQLLKTDKKLIYKGYFFPQQSTHFKLWNGQSSIEPKGAVDLTDFEVFYLCPRLLQWENQFLSFLTLNKEKINSCRKLLETHTQATLHGPEGAHSSPLITGLTLQED